VSACCTAVRPIGCCCQRRQHEFKIEGDEAPKELGVAGVFPSPPGDIYGSAEGQFFAL